jgi:hypothetical protein
VNPHQTTLEEALRLVQVDLAPRHRQPSAVMVLVATAVAALVTMHLPIAAVTYNCVVRIARVGDRLHTEGESTIRFSA